MVRNQAIVAGTLSARKLAQYNSGTRVPATTAPLPIPSAVVCPWTCTLMRLMVVGIVTSKSLARTVLPTRGNASIEPELFPFLDPVAAAPCSVAQRV